MNYLLQPDHVLPLVGILGMKPRDIIDYSMLQFVVHLPLVLFLVRILNHTFRIPTTRSKISRSTSHNAQAARHNAAAPTILRLNRRNGVGHPECIDRNRICFCVSSFKACSTCRLAAAGAARRGGKSSSARCPDASAARRS